MRCLDRFCALRTVEEKQTLEVAEGTAKKPAPDCEIDAEHAEVQADDVAEEDEDDGPPEEVIVSPVCDRSCIRDLWPFAYGKDYYHGLISGIIGSEAIAHFIYISATAHPAALLAAHELGMGVHVVLSKVRQHSTSHGKLLLRNTIFNDLYAIEKKSAQHAKRVLVGDLAFVPIAAPRDQPVFFFDASPPKDGNWRVGIDSCPTTEFLERAVPKLLSRELEEFGLAIADEGGVRRLIANRGFREEEIIAPMTALLFSVATAVVEFLNSGGNAALLDAPLLKVEGLLGQSSVNPEATASIFAIPTGIGRLLCDYRSVRKFANVAIMAFPSEGAQDGFLQIRARTHNGCGIAAGATLCCDFGERYVAASAGDIQPAKRFRGALEAFFYEQAKVNAAAACSDIDLPDSQGAKAAVTESTSSPPAKKLQAGPATPAPAAASPAKAGTATSAAAAAPAAAAAAAAARSASSVPTSVLNTSGDWELASSNDGKLTLTNITKQNKRVPPKTVLFLLSKGSVDDSPGATQFPFVFKKSNEIVLTSAKAGSGYDLVTLKDVIKESSAAALYQHGAFTKAVAPPSFTCKKVMQYNPHAEEKASCAVLGGGAALTAGSEVAFRWVVAAQGGKIMPVGVALVCTKQISLAAGQVKVL